MSGSEVDYGAFNTYFMATSKRAMEESTEWSPAIADISMSASTTGSVGTSSAMFFGAQNRQALRSMNAYLKDQLAGKLSLANAAVNVALAYHDGDLGQKGQVTDVMDGILNPQGKDGTVRGQMDQPPGEGDSGTTGSNGATGDGLPQATVNSDGAIVDADGNVLFDADGTPGDSAALANAGLNPDGTPIAGANGSGAGMSPYVAYLNRVRASQNQYYENWTGVSPELGDDPSQIPEEGEEPEQSQESTSRSYPELVRPPEESGGDAPAEPEPEPDPEDLPEVSVYDDPSPQTTAPDRAPANEPHGGI